MLKKIALLVPFCNGVGSIGWVAQCQARELSRYFEVTLFTAAYNDTGPEVYAVRLVRTVNWRYLRRFAHVPNEVSLAWAIGRRLADTHRKHDFDAVLAHGHSLGLASARVMRRSGVPTVLAVHGEISTRPKGTYDRWLSRYYWWTSKRAYLLCDRVLALTPNMKAVLQKRKVASERIVIIPNGVDFGELSHRVSIQPSSDSRILQLLFVGRLNLEKGVDILLNACALAAKRDLNFFLKIVGDGQDRAALVQLALTLGIADKVFFAGWVPRCELGAWYQRADVLCVPSRDDPFPTVVIEALAEGLPVIGTRVGGIPWQIEHEQSGWLVPSDSPEAFTLAIQEAASARASLAAMGRNGQEKVRERFSWLAVGRQLATVIESLMDERSRTPKKTQGVI